MKKLSLLFALFLSVLFSACHKDKAPNSPNPTDDTLTVNDTLAEYKKLPPESTTGANTFAYMLNGKTYLPDGSGILHTPVYRTYKDKSLYIRTGIPARNSNNEPGERVLIISLENCTDTGVYYVSDKPFFSFQDYPAPCSYTQNLDATLEITRLDPVNKIISGRFNCLLPNGVCGNIKITNGRFDLKY